MRKLILLLALIRFASAQDWTVVKPLRYAQSPRECLSSDGEYLAATGLDGNVRLWQVTSGALLRAAKSQSDWTYGCEFTPDDRAVAAIHQHGFISVWDTATGSELISSGKFHSQIYGSGASIHLSANLAFAAVTDNGRIKELWDLKGKQIDFPDAPGKIGPFLKNGSVVLLAGEAGIVAANLVTDAALDQIGCANPSSFHALSQDKALFVCNDGAIHEWIPGAAGSFRVFYRTVQPAKSEILYTPDASQIVYQSQVGAWVIESTAGGQSHAVNLPSDAVVLGIRPDHKLVLRRDLPGVERIELFDPSTESVLSSFFTQGVLDSVTHTARSPDGRFLAVGGLRGDLVVWDLVNGVRAFQTASGDTEDLEFSPSGGYLMIVRTGLVYLYETETWRIVITPPSPIEFDRASAWFESDQMISLEVSQRQRNLSPAAQHRFRLDLSKFQWSAVDSPADLSPFTRIVGDYRVERRSQSWTVSPLDRPDQAFALPGSDQAALGESDRTANNMLVLQLPGGSAVVYRIQEEGTTLSAQKVMAANEKDIDSSLVTSRFLLLGSDHGYLSRIDLGDPAKRVGIQLEPDKILDLQLSQNGDILFVGQAQGISLVELASMKPLANLYSFADSGWAVTTASGLFDTDRFADLPISLVRPRQPMSAISLGSMIRTRFTPRLFYRLLNGERPQFAGGESSLASPPVVSLQRITPALDGTALVEVSISPANDSPAAAPNPVEQLVLLRDGQVVRRLQSSAAKPLTGVVRFEKVNMGNNAQPVFSSYAFDAAGIKSPESSLITRQIAAQVTVPSIHILAIGVGQVASDSRLRLPYAPNDARNLSGSFASLLQTQSQYKVRQRVLVSEAGQPGATKSQIRDALALLSSVAQPGDQILISFSGHGLLNSKGEYVLVPSDFVASNTASGISAEELRAWIEPADAAGVTLILDTCHSAGAVESPQFRAGPLGDRSFGQLAYDKRMMVLAASQAEGLAYESDHLKMGLLSYVLSELGMRQGLADWNPRNNALELRELLQFAVAKAQSVDLETGRLAAPAPRTRGVRVKPAAGSSAGYSLARPVLFDFATGTALRLATY